MIKERLKSNKITHFLGKLILDSYCFYVDPIFECFNKLFITVSHKYGYLKKYKNKFKGERCFIVCTGPSLNYNDLNRIKNEYSFSMNSIIRILDKTDWKPTFYGIQDYEVFGKLKGDIQLYSNKYFFVSDETYKKYNSVLNQKSVDVFKLFYHGTKRNLKKPSIKFSSDITKGLYNGYTITYSLMQIAVYMGFKEIYLLGCDSNYDPDPNKRYFVSHGHIDPNAPIAVQFQIKAYSVAKKYADKHGIKIYNATRGGKLEVFERFNLDDVIPQNNT